MASDDVQTNLRIPADLKDRLTAAATENNRSLSAEVTSRLEASFAQRDQNGLQAILKLQIETIMNRVETLDLRMQLLRAKYDSAGEKHAEVAAVLAGIDSAGGPPDIRGNMIKVAKAQLVMNESVAEMDTFKAGIVELAGLRERLIQDVMEIKAQLTEANQSLDDRVRKIGFIPPQRDIL